MASLVEFIERAFAAGVDILQIRERDLPARDILSISEAAVRIARKTGACVMVNDRADVARCAGGGVHLTTRSLGVHAVKSAFGPEMIVGVSTHNLEEAVAAENGGADFVVFGPVFETSSKRSYGPPVGVASLGAVARSVRIPVLALGGITLANFHETIEEGAAGIAAISLFARAADLERVVKTIKRFGSVSPK
ncbi:MAG: thiamine phosphate synthase [Blastocatellia bacterium]